MPAQAAAGTTKRSYRRRQPTPQVSESRRDLDAFLTLVKQTKAPRVRDFLMNLYDSVPHVFGTNGIAVKPEVATEIKEVAAEAPAPRRQPAAQQPQRRSAPAQSQGQAEDFA